MNISFGSPKTPSWLRVSRPGHLTLIVLAASLTFFSKPARAGNETWIGGTGTWNTPDDWNGGAWTSGSTAIFNATAGTVTVGAATAGGLTFNTAGYTLSTGTLTLNTGTVITTTSGTTTFSSLVLSAAGGATLTKTGAGTLALSTASNGTGGLGTGASPVVWTITGGSFSNGIFNSILSIGAGNNLGAAPNTATTQIILDAGTLQITGTNDSPPIGVTRTIQVNTAGGAILDNFGNTGSSGFASNIVDNAGSGSSLYLANTSGETLISGAISGGGSVTWNGPGTLVLSSTTSSYNGGTTINAGTVSISSNANIGANGSTVTMNGGTLATTANMTGGAFTDSIATGSTGGTINVAAGTSFAINNFNNGTGNITGSGPLTLAGGGQLILSANDSGYSGNWTVSSGLLEVQYNGSTSLGSGSVTVDAGGELADDWAGNISNSIISQGGTLSFAIIDGGVYSGGISLASGTTTIGMRDFYSTSTPRSGTISGGISGIGALNVVGAGTLTLSGSNSYTGGTIINSGVVQIAADDNLGASSSALMLNGGTLASVQTAEIDLSQTLATGTTGGTIQLDNGVPSSSNNKIALENTGQITGSGPIAVTNDGLLSIGGANAGYSGNWTLDGGVMELTNNGAAGSGMITVNSGAELTTLGSQITNALTLNGGAISWDFFSGSGNYEGPVSLLAGGGTVSLVNFYGGGGAINGTISGNISGAGGLTVTDVGPSATTAGGVLTLTGDNSYTGPTIVAADTLIVTGSIAGTSNVTVNSGATLGGGGSVTTSGSTTVSGTIYPGTDLGTAGTMLTLSSSNVIFNDGSTFEVNLDDANDKTDLLAINGNLILNGNDTLTLNLLSGLTSGRSYVILTYTGTLSGQFLLSNTLPGYEINYSVADEIIVEEVPEPATWAMLLGGIGVLGVVRRRIGSGRRENL